MIEERNILFEPVNELSSSGKKYMQFFSAFSACPLFLRIMVFILVLVSATPLLAQTRPIRELAPGVFYYFGDELQQKSANCTWIVFKDYVLAIDANYPWGAEEILKEIRKITDKPVRFLFNTHYHHDHTFGNGVFAEAGATIVSSQTTADEIGSWI